MFVDFGARPPEINAALIYGGDGSATMQAAAAAWDGLSANLQTTANSYKAVVSRLATEEWLGPSSAAMATKITPHMMWMDTAAAQAEQTAMQARAVAAAFEGAFAMTPPPPVIAANRSLQSSLIATNFLGQNTGAIMATEALYMEMWAQCAAAMYGYAASTAAASQLTPFAPATQNPNPAGQSMQEAAKANAEKNSGQGSAGNVLSGLLGNLFNSGESGGILGDAGGAGIGPNANLWNTITSTGAINPAMATSMIADLAVVQEFNEAIPGRFAPGAFTPVLPALQPTTTAMLASAGAPASTSAGLASAPASVSAGMARATPIGALSVPASWNGAAPAAAATSVLPGHSPAAAAPSGGHGAPGVPLAGMGRGNGVTGPRYGIRPTVMARPPAAGYAPELF
ncbi:hypothetical protein BHQ15_17665 [Mycolicibacillus koreensis]|nr:hypothetical protein BHQ15_17665 [Mycolicibacillus koreensis]